MTGQGVCSQTAKPSCSRPQLFLTAANSPIVQLTHHAFTWVCRGRSRDGRRGLLRVDIAAHLVVGTQHSREVGGWARDCLRTHFPELFFQFELLRTLSSKVFYPLQFPIAREASCWNLHCNLARKVIVCWLLRIHLISTDKYHCMVAVHCSCPLVWRNRAMEMYSLLEYHQGVQQSVPHPVCDLAIKILSMHLPRLA